jgi:nicotinamidase/pyrazinamidase
MFDRRQLLVGLGALTAAGMTPKALEAAGKVSLDRTSVLLVIDVQNCFLPGGSLAVKDGDKVVPVINAIAKKFADVVMTQDWHTPGHISFASSHSGKKPFETT